MKLGLRLLLGFFFIAGLAAVFVLRAFVVEIKPSAREVMEDILVDTSNLLAEQAAGPLAAMPPGGTLEDSELARGIRDYATRPVNARIWGLDKRSLDFRVYVTDATGRVVLDSRTPSAVGQDYSRWNDVMRTLRGEYGARSTHESAQKNEDGTMYVAAPVQRDGRLLGVLTVSKPASTMARFVDRAERKVLVAGGWLFGLSLLVGVLVTLWIVWSVRRLRHYAQHVQAGQALAVPRLPGELGDLARAMEAMRLRLEGREHMEQVVRAFTHELKSPLAAIRGAGELLQDPLPAADRQLFAMQVLEQSERLRVLVDRMLELSKLESRGSLAHAPRIRLDSCAARALLAQQARIGQRGLQVRWLRQETAETRGDAELVALAIGNLLANALDFSPEGALLDLSVWRDGAHVLFELRDHGPGVPDYALPQLDKRFYSTARPNGGDKGSGLGLAIVEQVMALHGGSLELTPAEPGLTARLRFPAG
ncbi:sensor histidine kinase [Bordetella ansorpii]|uniref:histidine kinase n=1 Tax=Bordetella ansorpii TaxID=288768 RepID=A0A157SAI0_9BORD|nr:two-component system sensor histidine kinase CreC [Bordetella ansorpii]SAI67440.1 sensor histidine kinase [Bordetella ansorpii]